MGKDGRLTGVVPELGEAFEKIAAERQRREDRADYERELAGIDIGRTARFHDAEFVDERRERRSGASSRTQRSAEREYASRLQRLLATNAAYAQLYNDTMTSLGDAEAATDGAIAKAQRILEEAREQLDRTLSRAAKLSDGTRVFRDARGNVWTEHGMRVSEAEAAHIEWRGDEPAYEQFSEESEAVRDRLTRLEALQGFRVDTLGRIRDRMSDQDNPPSSDEVERFKRDIQENMPPEARTEQNASFSATEVAVTAHAPAVRAL